MVPQCAHSHCRAAGASSPSARMASGIGIRRCRSRGQPPASCQRASSRPWRAAMTSRSSRASGARFRPLSRHRRVEPRLFVIEIEMPRNAAGTPRRGAEPRHLPGRTAHRQPVAQPVGVNRRQRRMRDPRALPALGGVRAAPERSSTASVHRSSSRAGLSTTIRARRR